jgi:hypothetical protein
MGQVVFNSVIGEKGRELQSPVVSMPAIDHAITISQAAATKSKFRADPKLSSEISAFYNKALQQGANMREVATNPAAVAKSLAVNLSEAAVKEIQAAAELPGAQLPSAAKVAGGVTVVCVAVIVVLCADVGPDQDEVIVDRSGMLKL